VIELLLAVFAASLVGSLHCAGMCGGIVALCSRRGAGVVDQLCYHGARGLTYTLVGALAGGLGSVFAIGGRLLGLQRAVAVVAGVALIGAGAYTLWRAAGGRAPRLLTRLVPRLQAGVGKAVAAGADLPPRTYAALLGLLTPLLPCGWLYVFALAAAGTASPLSGAAVMATFWLGTVPILFALALGLRAAANRARKLGPALAGLVLVAVGALLVAERGRLDYAVVAQPPTAVPSEAPCCGGDPVESRAAPPPAVPTEAPCCAGDPAERTP